MLRLILMISVAIAPDAGGNEMIEALASKPTHCTYEYAYEMYGAHCGSLKLSEIPSLSGSIEILDFSENKLRELNSDTLSYYTNLKFLYLSENQIYYVEKDAFTALTYLETLDLSKNVIFELPTSIFQLPSLRKLYLNGNPLFHINAEYITPPVKAPLDVLDMSDCKITELPNWGILPNLVLYNISNNPLKTLGTKHFANMCNLQKVDLTGSIEKINLCVLSPVIWWIKQKGISFDLKDYSPLSSKEFTSCKGLSDDLNKVLNATYHHCKSNYSQIPYTPKVTRNKWLKICGGLAAFLVGFIFLLYLMHMCNVIKTKRRAEAKAKSLPQVEDKQATSVLLNNA